VIQLYTRVVPMLYTDGFKNIQLLQIRWIEVRKHMTVPKTSDMRDVSKMCVMNASLSVQEG
jgi:hypothetical protein